MCFGWPAPAPLTFFEWMLIVNTTVSDCVLNISPFKDYREIDPRVIVKSTIIVRPHDLM
jgi:hypothetical protein